MSVDTLQDSKARLTTPTLVHDYELNPNRGFFSVVLPIERTNLVTNPSFETNTTGYTAQSGATLTRTNVTQRRGVFSLQVKPGLANDSGIFYTTSNLILGSTYAFSLDVFIRGGAKYALNVTDGINTFVSKAIVGNGYWERFSLMFTATTNGAHRLFLQKNGNSDTREFFTDGWQLELCGANDLYPTTYIDGDQAGYVVNQVPAAYFWTGTPHGSTSVRNGQTRAGGQVVRLSDLGLHVTAYIGLSMTPVQNVSTPFGLLGGAIYQRTVSGTRLFTLIGFVTGRTYATIQRNHRALVDAFKPDLLGVQQPLLLKYQLMDECGTPVGEEIDMSVNYSKGLEGNTDNLNQERVSIQFVDFHNYQNLTGDVGAALAISSGFAAPNPAFLVTRNRAGLWSKLGSQPQSTVLSMAEGLNGNIYLGGTFTNLGGVGGTVLIGRWDGSNFFPLGGGITGTKVNAIVIGPDGRVYAGGVFTKAGSTLVNNIAVYDPNTDSWAAMGTGVTAGVANPVFGMAIGPDGNIYVGGQFTAAGGLANTKYIAVWNPTTSAWSAMGTGGSGGSGVGGPAVAAGLDGKIYVGAASGTSFGGVANTTDIARWNISSQAWESISISITGTNVNAIAVAPDGSIYAIGEYTVIGGVSANRIARFNGVTWTPLGTGLNNTGAGNNSGQLVVDKKGNVIVGGVNFTTAGGLPLLDSLAIWNGTAWIFGNIDLARPTIAQVQALLVTHSNDLYVSFNDSGAGKPSLYSGTTSITVNGEGAAPPKFIFYGKGTLYEIDNFTSGAVIYVNALTIQSNEVVTLDLTPGAVSLTSNLRGNLLSYILPGSNLATFNLLPGVNSLGIFILDGNATCAAYVKWQEQQWGIDGGLRR
jgi:hypothetical protein